MSVIITGIDMSKRGCWSCKLRTRNNCFFGNKESIDDPYHSKNKLDDCPLKSVEGLIEFIKDRSYPVQYDINSIEQGMAITGIEQAIKEYCGVSENER